MEARRSKVGQIEEEFDEGMVESSNPSHVQSPWAQGRSGSGNSESVRWRQSLSSLVLQRSLVGCDRWNKAGSPDQVEKLPGSNALASFCEKDESAKEFTKELRSILEVTAATGRYWHDWQQLRMLLCFRLTQVLQEFHKQQYPEDGTALIGPPAPGSESFPQMMERLVQNLDAFTDGAPFTNQRLCEILLCPKDTYNNLDKLALALEKLLMVQSTYASSTDPYPLQPLPGSVPTEMPVEAHKVVKLDGVSMNGAQDSIVSFKEMPVIDEEMVDVERVLDAQAAVIDMVANNNSDMLHEPSVTEIPQVPSTNSLILHDPAVVDLPQVPGTSSEMVHDSTAADQIHVLSTTSEMLLESTAAELVQATATNTDMLHDSTGSDLSEIPGTNFEMLHDSTVVELPQVTGTNSEMLHDSTVVELPQAAASNTEMIHDSSVVELGSAVVLPPAGSNTEMLHDSTVVELPSVPEVTIHNIVANLSIPAEPLKKQADSAGVDSSKASQGSVDMKEIIPEDSVKSIVTKEDTERRPEDVSMGIAS
ncbi:hypothetical protein AXG93_374s1160 [Marchantia polymorpha subsp. ruderalis]|uniref:Serine/threonine-protein phosphatase 4 regulatory subunit 2 n=1 Tax=Marchantia polymorpha subsp. ruderalis TaxID=1480154 RepID=A0A176WIB0_MARPO|nr:hypothetical protein AXG93_374s1160 [Marchantia polymorpha subsp. ruderalis]